MQWIRICLPMHGTQVQSLVWEDPACHRATKPVLCNKRRHHSEKPKHCKERENTLKKITNRVTGMCGTVTKDPAFVASKFQKENVAERI